MRVMYNGKIQENMTLPSTWERLVVALRQRCNISPSVQINVFDGDGMFLKVDMSSMTQFVLCSSPEYQFRSLDDIEEWDTLIVRLAGVKHLQFTTTLAVGGTPPQVTPDISEANKKRQIQRIEQLNYEKALRQPQVDGLSALPTNWSDAPIPKESDQGKRLATTWAQKLEPLQR